MPTESNQPPQPAGFEPLERWMQGQQALPGTSLTLRYVRYMAGLASKAAEEAAAQAATSRTLQEMFSADRNSQTTRQAREMWSALQAVLENTARRLANPEELLDTPDFRREINNVAHCIAEVARSSKLLTDQREHKLGRMALALSGLATQPSVSLKLGGNRRFHLEPGGNPVSLETWVPNKLGPDSSVAKELFRNHALWDLGGKYSAWFAWKSMHTRVQVQFPGPISDEPSRTDLGLAIALQEHKYERNYLEHLKRVLERRDAPSLSDQAHEELKRFGGGRLEERIRAADNRARGIIDALRIRLGEPSDVRLVETPGAAARGPGGIAGAEHLANGLFLALVGSQWFDAVLSGDGEKLKQAAASTIFAGVAGLAPLAVERRWGRIRANALSTLFGLGFSEISGYATIKAAGDLWEGEPGAAYNFATSSLDTAAGTAAMAMTGLAAMGERAHPFLARAALGLTIASLAAHVTYPILKKAGFVTADQQPTGFETRRSAASPNLTLAAATVAV